MSHNRCLVAVLAVGVTFFPAVPAEGGGLGQFVKDVGHTIEKAAQDTGKTIEKGAQDTARTVGKAGTDTRIAVGKAGTDARRTLAKAGTDARVGAQAAEKGLNHFGDEFSKWFCSIATLGASDTGRASCSTSAGYNSSGRTYDPTDPTTVQPIPADRLMLPSKADLDSMYRFQTPPQEFQAWERREDAILKNYLGPGDHIGVPWSNTSGTPPISPTAEPIVRGNGHFLDLRRDSRYPGGYRFHGGTDYLTQVGDPIFAIAEGAITRVFIASADGARAGLTALEIRMNNGYTAQYLYVKPADEIARRIAARQFPIPVASGTVIGTSQDLHTLWKDKKGVTHPAYPMSVEQHLHLTLKDPNGRYVSPDGTGVLVMKKGERPKVESPRPRGKPH